MPESTFIKLYRQLNPQQKKAVDLIEGPVMVVAGPGTGKTQILTLRIANILKRVDIQPENILALTFTESGVSAMRRRLVETIGSPGYESSMHTFHGFCNDVIKNYPEAFSHIVDAQNITEVDQINVIEATMKKLQLKEIRPFGKPSYYVPAVLSAINQLKREGIDPEAFSRIVEAERNTLAAADDLHHTKGPYKGYVKGKYQQIYRNIAKQGELAKIYHAYQSHLVQGRFYDYSDMIMEVFQALAQNKDLLLTLQERYHYILVDEHQDSNNAQNRIVELLGSFHPNPNIFVVGDEEQAIFRFQGASLENFHYFKKLYPKAELITLDENYRSTQAILDSADSLLTRQKKLKARRGLPEKKVALLAFSKPEVEHYFVAQDIQEKLQKGVAPEQIAILCRDNRDAFPFQRMLEKIGVPFSIESDQDILTDPDIKKFIVLLRAINDFGSQELFLEMLHIDFFGVDPLDVYKIVEHAKTGAVSVFDTIKSNSLELESPEKIEAVQKKLSLWAVASRNQPLLDLLEEVIRKSGFLAHLLAKRNSVEKIDKLNTLMNEIRQLVEIHKDFGLKQLLAYIDTLAVHNVLVQRGTRGQLVPRVALTTTHKAKGREFDYVYIVQAVDKHWGNRRGKNILKLPPKVFSLGGDIIEEGNPQDDERRLFYVALTRARKGVTISYAKESRNKREQLPSSFIHEIRSDLIERINVSQYEKNFEQEKALLFAPSVFSGTSIREKEFVKQLFLKNGLSVSGLNNYLRCPWKYFYNNLLHIPRSPSKPQMFGIAVHAALRDFFEHYKRAKPSKALLLGSFARLLKRQPLQREDLKIILTRGKKALAGYYDSYKNTWRTSTLNEFAIKGVLLAPDIRMNGIIDKMELIGGTREVNIVDYKTGKPKSRKFIEGMTKDSKGDMKRQLTFYHLLLQKQGRYRMVSGEIDFVEPDTAKRYRKEKFVITKEETSALEELLKLVCREITTLAFWNRRCDEKDCEFCALREMM